MYQHVSYLDDVVGGPSSPCLVSGLLRASLVTPDRLWLFVMVLRLMALYVQ